jgi:IclR family KDG regulon transcriptional repressor
MNELGTTGRVLTILETLSKEKELNLERISERTEIPKVTALRLLTTLCKSKYIVKNQNDSYSLTLRMFSVGSRALDWTEIIELSRPIVEKLQEELEETIHMGILEDSKAVYIMKEESSHTVRMYSRVGKNIPLYCSGIGKCLLSYQGEEYIDEYIKKTDLKRRATKTITDKDLLKKELSQIKERGYGFDDEENEGGIFCISTPIFNHEGLIEAALSVSWPIYRIEKDEIPTFIKKIKSAADEISILLGYLPE